MKKSFLYVASILAVFIAAYQGIVKIPVPDSDQPPQITIHSVAIIGAIGDSVSDTAKIMFSQKGENAEHQLLLLLIPSQSDSLVASGSVPKLYHTPRPRDKLSAYVTATAQNLIAHRFY